MRISDWSSDVCSSDLLDLDQLRGFFLGRIALASGFQMAAHPVGIRPVELPFCIAPAIFARRLGDGVEPILHKVHDQARIIAIATFSEKNGGEGDRKSVVSGKRGLVRVALSWRGVLKKKNKN